MKKNKYDVPDFREIMTTTDSTLPEISDDTFNAVKVGLDNYFNFKKGENTNKDELIEQLALAAHYAYEEVEHWYKVTLKLEKQGKVNANIRGHNEHNKGIQTQKDKHGSNTSPFKEHEQSIIKSFDEYQTSLSLFDKKIKLTDVKTTIETKANKTIPQSTFDYWRKNYTNSKGKTIFKCPNEY